MLTETEWECLAWGGERTGQFASGDAPEEACKHANVFNRSAAAASPESPIDPAPYDDGYAGIAPLGQFEPNTFGV